MGKRILLCKCYGERIDSERLQIIEDSLRNLNAEISILSDLCLLITSGRERLLDVFHKGEEYLVIGCYNRSMKLLLEQINIHPVDYSLKYINIIESTDDEIFQNIASFCNGSEQVNSLNEITVSTGWISWFPVIDYSRCSGCGQCADFCLFGVFEKTNGSVKVVNPKECKNNCPACARICPQTAIIFPKYKFGGAIGGSDNIDEIAEQKRQSDDIKNILDGDIYSVLEKRKNKRQSIIQTEAMKKAIDERDSALKKT